MKSKKVLYLLLTLLFVTLLSSSLFADETNEEDIYSGVGQYMGFIQVQTSNWVYRNNFDDTGAGYGTDTFNTVFNNETQAATPSSLVDAVLDGDGVYTVSLIGADFEGSTDFNMVGLSTNLPIDGPIQISDARLLYGTKKITSTAIQKNDDKKFVHMMLINQYDKEMKDTVNFAVPSTGTDIHIEFTVTGFGYENESLKEEEIVVESEPTTRVESTTTTETETDAAMDESTDTETSQLNTTIIVISLLIIVIVVVVGIISITKRKRK